MSKTRSGQPASGSRPTRRSLVELTAAASRAADDGLLVMLDSLTTASPDDPPQVEHAAERPDCTAVASRCIELAGSDSAAEMMVKIAKAYQNSVLENIKVGLNAALDHGKNFAETKGGSKGASQARRGDGGENDFVTSFGGAAAEFRAEALELMKANMVTALEYVRELAAAKTAAEFVELSATQARKQCELALKQAGALQSLAQAVTKSGAA
jgi:hypothetical protein